MCLEGLEYSFFCIAEVHVGGNELEGLIPLFLYFYFVGSAAFVV